MKLTILTKTLQTMVTKVSKGAGNNKLLPITSMLDINVKDKLLTLTTTDMNNYVSVQESGINCEDFNIVILIDTFSKIVSKMTTDTITLELTENSLKVVGNGTYNIPFCLDEEGELVKFPKYSFPETFETSQIKYSDIKSIMDNNGDCVSTDMTTPALTGYYFGTNTITTDAVAICITRKELFKSPILISTRVVDLLNLFTVEDINVKIANDKIIFYTNDVTVYATLMTEIEDYPVEGIETYIDASFKYNCKVDKVGLLGVLERMSIFTNNIYDNNTVNIVFNDKGMLMTNKDSTATELLKYNSVNADSNISYTCNINIDIFKNMVASCSTDSITIYFAHETNTCIKLEDNNIIKIIALDDDETSEETVEDETIDETVDIDDLI